MKAVMIGVLFLIAGTIEASPRWVKPIDGAGTQGKLDFWTGFSLFRSPWVAAPASTKGRDGLGPLFNARSCDACHHNGAHGKFPEQGFGLVVRLGLRDNSAEIAGYGEQIQTHSVDSITGGDQVPPEAEFSVQWRQVSKIFGDEKFVLKKPELQWQRQHYGDWPQNTVFSLRLAPAVFGLGDIERISDQEILAAEDENDRDNDGISGRANKVINRATGKLDVGRYGYKAEQPNLRQQIAAAFNEDIGISSWLYPEQNCTAQQAQCLKAENGNSPEESAEISRDKLELVSTFSMLLQPVDAKRHASTEGRTLFTAVGCDLCHRAFTKVNFYSDLLLHDLGDDLADHRPVFNANGREWRTTPLRGISRKLQSQPVRLLHDGRAANIEQAILWHGGEASAARMNYLKLPIEQRRQLIEFIKAI